MRRRRIRPFRVLPIVLAFALTAALLLCVLPLSGAEEPCHPREVDARTGIQAMAVSVAQAAIRDTGVAKLCKAHECRWASRLAYHLATAGMAMTVAEADRLAYGHAVNPSDAEGAAGGTCFVVFTGDVGAPMRISFLVFTHPRDGRADHPDGVVVEAYVSRADGANVLLVREKLLVDGIHEEQ